MNILLGLLGLAVVVFIIYKVINDGKKHREYKEKHKADIKAHPENYYVSEGGLIPDPPPEETPTDTTAE